MITRVELTNFMSHKHTVIEPAAGLTVLVGPNNVGKSAVVAALQILCHNDPSTYVRRHGARECSVKVHTDDGHVIEWRRKTAPSYVIDGQVFDRLKVGGQPDQLAQALRLRNVDAGGDADFDVHFGTQKSPIFLLGSSAANAARFFASSSDAIRLVAIQKRHKEKHSEKKREKDRLETQSRRVNAELEVLEPVVEVENRLAALECAYVELTQLEAWIDAATRCESALRRQQEDLAECAERALAFSTLKRPPELAPSESLEGMIAALAGEEQKRAQAETRGDILALLTLPPAMHDVAQLGRLTETIATYASDVEQSEAECRSLARLPNPPDVADLDSLRELIERLTALSREVALADERTIALRTLTPPHVPPPTAEIQTAIARLEQAATELRLREADLKDARDDFDVATEDLRTRAAGQVCPTCGSTLDPDRMVACAADGRHKQ